MKHNNHLAFQISKEEILFLTGYKDVLWDNLLSETGRTTLALTSGLCEVSQCNRPPCLPPLLSCTSYALWLNHKVCTQRFVYGRFVSASHPLTESPGEIRYTHTSRLGILPNFQNTFH